MGHHVKKALKGKDHPFKAGIHKKHNVASKALHKKGNPIAEMWKGKDWGKIGTKKTKKDFFLT